MSDSRDKIRALTDREQAREKLPIFFGSRENYLHPFREALGNANDEVSNNFSKGVITVVLDDDMQTITVKDTGRGIPISGETDGKPNYELLFETLFAGTNYDNKNNGKITVGTNGVGLTVTNFTSSLFKVVSVRNGFQHELTYTEGGSKKEFKEIKLDSDKAHGSIFKFRLDPSMYTNVIYDKDEVREIIRHVAATSPNIKFKFVFGGETEEIEFKGLQDYFENIIKDVTSSPIYGPEIEVNEEDELNKIVILFSTSSEPVQESFLNYNWLPDKGSIHDGVMSGVRSYVNKAAHSRKLIDAKTNILVGDVEDSVSYVCSMLSTNVEYANQTKLSTDKKLYRRIAVNYVQSLLEAYEAEQPKEFDKFIKHIVQVNKFNNRNNAAKQALKKKLNEKVDGLQNRIENLVECKVYGPEAELFIAEGQSALGSLVLARDPMYQAAYPLRGKILNCLKADYATIFKNAIITDLVKALGCGIEADKKNKDLDSFNKDLLRFGKIIIATDADADGQQIACLIITMIYRLMPALVRDGHVYIAKTPLYEVKLKNDEMVYIFSESEKDEKLKELEGKVETVARCKGLGELDAETMSFTAMDKETRNLERVTMEDAEKAVSAIEMFMGQEIGPRKEYIENNIHKYIDNVIGE